MKLLYSWLNNLIFHPYSKVQRELEELRDNVRQLANGNSKRAGDLMATLNGEDQWMFKKENNPTEDKCNGPKL